MSDIAKIRWQCRRGMRELDVLLERFLQRDFATANEAEKLAFQELLALSDPQLASYLLRGQRHEDSGSRDVITKILGQPGT